MENAMQSSADTILFARHCQDLLREKKIRQAIDLCEKGVRNFPFYAEGHYILGRCYQALGQVDEAKNELERTLFYAPVHLKALNSLAFILYKKNLKNMADEYLLTVALNDPLNFELHDYLKQEKLYSMLYPPFTQENKHSESDELIDENADDKMTIVEQVTHSTQEANSENDPNAIHGLDDIFTDPEKNSKDNTNEIEQLAPPIAEESTVKDKDEINIASGLESRLTESEEDTSVEEVGGSALELDDSREAFEVNSIIENISEVEANKLDLSQYANIEDDFSTLLFSMEKDFQETLNETIEDDEVDLNDEIFSTDEELLAEEKPIENTAILFNNSDDENTAMVGNKDEEIAADALFEEDEAESEKAAENIIGDTKTTELPQANKSDKFKNSPDELSKIITQLENRDDAPPKKVDVDTLDQAANNEDLGPTSEDGNIQDIMNNASLVTPTFGEILIAQKKFEEARTVFVKLSEEKPDVERYKKKIQFLDKLIALQK
jgi:tetratricopeptide (TPR) repeat protein